VFRKFRGSAAVLAVIGGSLVLSACGSSSSSSSSSAAASPATGTSAASAGTTGSGSSKLAPRTIGIVDVTAASDGAHRGQLYAEDAIKRLGWKYISIDAAADPTKEEAGMVSLVAQHVDAIISDANQPSAIAGGLAQAKAAGIPVIGVAGTVPPNPDLAAIYSTNYYDVGKAMDQYLFAHLPKGAAIGVLETPTYYALKQMDVQFAKDIKSRPDLKVVGIHQLDAANLVTDATNTVTSWLSAYPNLKGIWADIDVPAPAIANLLKSKGLCGKVVFVSNGGGLADLAGIRGGCVTATANIEYASSYYAVDALANYFAHHTPIPANPTYPTNFQAVAMVSKANLPASPNTYVPTTFRQYFYAKWAKEFGAH
jgi:ABC-type sugar transport system substrate-binding protein